MTQEKTIDCLHCKGKMNIELKNTDPNSQNEKVILQSFVPAFRCSDDATCGKIHPNENYQNRPLGVCTKCKQFAKNSIGQCSWCLSENSLRLLNPAYLDQVGIPKPELFE